MVSLESLFDQRLKDLGVTVALIHRGVRRETIEIAFSFVVIDPHALAALDHHVERMVIVGAVEVFEIDEILSALFFFSYERGLHKSLSFPAQSF